jgi:hypothetical protein
MLYKSLCDRQPFPGPSMIEAFAQIHDADQLPSPRHHDPSVPVALGAICSKALRVTPTDRYRDGDDMARDLGAYLSGSPISIQSRSPMGQLARPVAAVLLVLVLLTAAVSWALPRGPHAPLPKATTTLDTPADRELNALLQRGRLAPVRSLWSIEDWLARHPKHPRSEEAKACARDSRTQALSRPVVSLRVRNTQGQPLSVVFAPLGAGQQLVLLSAPEEQGGGVFLRWRWDPRAGTAHPLPPWPSKPTGFTDPWDTSEGLLAVCADGKSVPQPLWLVDVRAETPSARSVTILSLSRRAQGAAISPDGARAAMYSDVATVVVDAETGDEIAHLKWPSPPQLVRFSRDGALLATITRERRNAKDLFVIHDLASQAPPRSVEVPRTDDLISTADGKEWILATRSGHVLRLAAHTGRRLGKWELRPEESAGLARPSSRALRRDPASDRLFLLRRTRLAAMHRARATGEPIEYFDLAPSTGQAAPYQGLSVDRSGAFLATSRQLDRESGELSVWVAPQSDVHAVGQTTREQSR